MNWRREPRVVVKSLPDERKALAARYTIDAEEAERREQLAVEKAAREVEAEAARRVAAEEVARQAPADEAAEGAGSAAPRAATEAERRTQLEPIETPTQPQPQLVLAPVDDPPAPTGIAEGDECERTVGLPIYRWFGND